MSDLSPQASTKVDGSDIQRADWEIAIIRYSRTSLDKEKAKIYLIDVCGAKFRDLDAITFCRSGVCDLILEGFNQDDIDFFKTSPKFSTHDDVEIYISLSQSRHHKLP